MNDEHFRRLAIDVQDVLSKHQVDFVDFTLNVRVTEDYFDAIENKQQSGEKGSLFVRLHIVSDENRAITLTELPDFHISSK